MPCDPNQNRKSRVYERRRYAVSAVKKAVIKKANEASVRARGLRRQQERLENEPVENPTTTDELINMEFGDPEEKLSRS
jgi:hypothetical protein